MEPIDRGALRELARNHWCGRCVTSPGTMETPCEMCGSVSGTVLALLDALDAAERERDAYRRAKGENDDRFMRERDDARRERDEARADVLRFGEHGGECASVHPWTGGARSMGADLCDCGFDDARARAEGRTG